VSLSISLGILYSLNNSWAGPIKKYLVRGQGQEEVLSLTGRTELWKAGMKEAVENPVFGHGYGVSRLFGKRLGDYGEQAAHLHNEFLEVFFNTGLLGLIPFLFMILRYTKWMTNFQGLSNVYGRYYAIHAICLLMMLLVSSFFEPRLGGRLNEIHLLFFLYLITLDHYHYYPVNT
jgi:O-antigen ligase